MPAHTKFFSELKREAVVLATVLGICVVIMCVIWYLYDEKIKTVEKKIDAVGYEFKK